MAERKNLLIELGTEELPPKALKKLALSFARSIRDHLDEADMLQPAESDYQYFAAPRRLAVLVKDVAGRQPDRVEARKGPAVAAAFDDQGNPTRAATGFAGSCGVEVDQLEREVTDKGEWLLFQQKVVGESIEHVVNAALEKAVRQLPVPKRMRWGDRSQEFVRPVHWLLALHGETTLPVSVLELQAGNLTRGHRFHAPAEISIPSANDYQSVLMQQGSVQVDYAERQDSIASQIQGLAKQVNATAIVDSGLLDEVTGLVEWPVAIYGEFDRQFLDVPAEVLISSMSDHQKYFHLTDSDGQLVPGFITISNIESSDPARVRAGNERVLRARLSDAEFFWRGDQKTDLQSRIPSLERVLFHKKLGSVHDKIQRMQTLAATIAGHIGANADEVKRACDLCKVDLVTDMVGEFPELQGTIGRYYAQNQGEPEAVAIAIEAHYQPRFAGDQLPQSAVSQCLALADRLDSLAGIFACGETPTGDKDPYALRRASLGVLRILIECGLDLDLVKLVDQAVQQFVDSAVAVPDGTSENVTGFVMERLRAYYQPLGFDTEEVNAVMRVAPSRPLDFDRRLHALHDFVSRQSDAALSLAAANKRIANILAKQDATISDKVDPEVFKHEAESHLYQQVTNADQVARRAFAEADYRGGLLELAGLKSPVDQFFDDVMVMDEDVSVRNNRLALLQSIRGLFLEVADISLIRVE